METTTIHYGIKLDRFIKKYGRKKQFVAAQLGVSRPTLDTRLSDGEFSPEQLIEVKKIIAKK